jgi:hypothetical protein
MSALTETSTTPKPLILTGPAPAPNPAREQQARLIAAGITCCPWCDGTGERLRASWKGADGRPDLVPCAPCAGTGEADRWTGEAADDWRRRRDATRAHAPEGTSG